MYPNGRELSSRDSCTRNEGLSSRDPCTRTEESYRHVTRVPETKGSPSAAAPLCGIGDGSVVGSAVLLIERSRVRVPAGVAE